jgi:hypothetical protein
MASIRRGYSDDFTLKNNSVGIGTSTGQEALDVVDGAVKGQDLKVTGISSFTAYEGFLRADQQIAENTTLSFDQGPSASLSGEIIVGTGVTVTIASVGLGTTMVGVGTHTIENTIDTTDVTRAGGSEIECLKVYNTFTPPSGGTNERPYAPKPGELYYNYDFKTIEFFDGYGWRQVDNTTQSSRAVITTGYDASTNYGGKYDYITITTLGNSAYFGDMQTASRDKQGCGSAIRALFGGGASPGGYENEIDYLTIASAGNGVDFGNLTAANLHNSALSSSTRAIWGGGYGPAFTNVIEYVEINTTGNALDFGDLSNDFDAGSGYLASFASPTRGVFACGTHPSSPAGDNVIRSAESITIASKGNSTRFGDLTAKHQRPTGASNGIKGLVFSGRNIPDISEISMTSGGVGIHFGNLSEGDYSGFSACNAIRAVHGGGEPSPSGGRTNRIEYVTMATGGDSQDFGDLSFAESFLTATSDSHGGLGGF